MCASGAFFAEGPGYRLRAFTLDDVPALAAFSEDENYWRFLSHGPRTPEQVHSFIETAMKTSQLPDGKERWWAVVDPHADVLIGTANLKQIGDAEDCFGSAGCSLAPTAQGRGLGPILGWDVIALAFDRFGFAKVECTCAEPNERSVHIMRHTVGLTYEGIRVTVGDGPRNPWPVHVFSLTENEFRTKQNPTHREG